MAASLPSHTMYSWAEPEGTRWDSSHASRRAALAASATTAGKPPLAPSAARALPKASAPPTAPKPTLAVGVTITGASAHPESTASCTCVLSIEAPARMVCGRGVFSALFASDSCCISARKESSVRTASASSTIRPRSWWSLSFPETAARERNSGVPTSTCASLNRSCSAAAYRPCSSHSPATLTRRGPVYVNIFAAFPGSYRDACAKGCRVGLLGEPPSSR
mmetsp:Transcript_29583/g.95567  ORF Transcript_29583/g.95567 Transcript_29583/m.95567 type:complete len:221 (-) Transcript_29583:692-1354(-)